MEFFNGSPVTFKEVVSVFKNRTYIPQIMILNLFVDKNAENDMSLKYIYINAAQKHNLSLLEDPHFFNAGFDLFLPEDHTFTATSVNKTNFNVKCSAQIVNLHSEELNQYYTGYYIHPRSSLSKTELRLANSTGIIDAGYRGPLIGMLDCSVESYNVSKFTRLLQICAPSLMPIYIKVIDSVDELGPETSRGEGGFGSTGI
jgi:dUTP pyrophosphatase